MVFLYYPLLNNPIPVFLFLFLAVLIYIKDSPVYVLVYLGVLASSNIISMAIAKYVDQIVFKSLLANGAKEVVRSRSRLFNNFWILFFCRLCSI